MGKVTSPERTTPALDKTPLFFPLKNFLRTPRIFHLSLLIPVTISIALEASKIRADYNIRTPDAIQIATAKKYADY